MAFPVPKSTRVGEIENPAQITWFCTQNIPTMFWVKFLLFPVGTAEIYFGQVLTNFPGLETTRARQVEN